jgi:hypothetical protein
MGGRRSAGEKGGLERLCELEMGDILIVVVWWRWEDRGRRRGTEEIDGDAEVFVSRLTRIVPSNETFEIDGLAMTNSLIPGFSKW